MLIDAWEPIWGGGQTQVWETSKILIKKYNYKIDIYTRKLFNDRNHIYNKNETHIRDKLRIFRIGPLGAFENFFCRIIWMINLIIVILYKQKSQKYSFIHAHAYTAGLPAKILSLMLNIPVVFTVHGCNNLDLAQFNLFTFYEKVLLTKIKYNVEISVSKHFLKYNNVNSNVEVIPNGVDVKKFEKISSKKFNINNIHLLWVGRFDKIKGLEILIKAFSQIRKINNKVRLILVGNGPEKNNILKLIKSLNLTKYIDSFDKKPFNEIINFYRKADVFILPSISEGQPITLLEAWAAKIPVIATNVGDNKYFVKQNHNGLLIRSNSTYDLTNAILKIISGRKILKMGKSGYTMVKRYYSWDIFVAKLIKIYNNIQFL